MIIELFWLWLALTLVAGFLIGVLVTRWGAKPTWHKATRALELEQKLEQQEQELKKYRAQVSDHFVETADLVNKLSKSYKEVYEHLEKGAYALVGEETLHKRLQDVEAKPITLEYIGQRRSLPKPASVKPDQAPHKALENKPEKEAQSKPERELVSKIKLDRPLFKD